MRQERFRFCWLVPAIAAFGGLLVRPAQAIPPGYTVTDIGTMGRDKSEAFGINCQGHVVGQAFGSLQWAGFLWEDGAMQDLGVLPVGPANFTAAYAVNDSGCVVGRSGGLSAYHHAFVWQDGVMTDLGTLAGTQSTAMDINSSAQVAGTSTYVPGDSIPRHAFRWDGGVMTDLGTLGGRDSYAMAINDAGQIVGYAQTADPAIRACLWDGEQTVNLGTLGAESYAHDINEAGQIVGNSFVPGGYIYRDGFLWEDGTMVKLPKPAGCDMSFAEAINEGGLIAGRVRLADSDNYRAVVWEGMAVHDLNDLIPPESGWLLTHAEDVNDSGQIAGWGEIDGQRHAFLLTPIPAPATVWLLSIGLPALLRRRGRRG